MIVVSVVIPCLNEADTLGECIKRALKGIADANVEGEVIVADYPEDFMHLLSCMFDEEGISFQIETTMRLINSSGGVSEVPHNALSDAKALMLWHQAKVVAAEA